MLSLLLLLVGCAKQPAIPGPLGPVGRPPAQPVVYHRADPRPRPSPEPARPAPPAEQPPFGRSLADAAAFYLDHAPRGFRRDCSGFVCAAADRAGWSLQGNTRSLFELAKETGAVHRRKRPRIGDLAFFDNTYDRNRNGRLDDDLTHVAVVIDVDDDGTITLAHAGTSRGRAEMQMNLYEPHDHVGATGEVINDFLRAAGRGDKPRTPRLAAECWRAFATLEPPEGPTR